MLCTLPANAYENFVYLEAAGKERDKGVNKNLKDSLFSFLFLFKCFSGWPWPVNWS